MAIAIVMGCTPTEESTEAPADQAAGEDQAVESEGESGAEDQAAEDDAAESETESQNETASSEDVEPVVDEGPTIWTGPTVTFEKADGADPTIAENQDRLTENVWITRGNAGGQIFNIRENNRAIYAVSPVGTQWAIGTTDELDSLEFDNFRPTVTYPREIVGTPLVMHLVESDIYLDVVITSWSQEKRGGFAWERSSPAE
jgi:hypothetical protein